MTSDSANPRATLLKNTGLLAVGKFSSQFLTFLLLPLYTRYLTPDEYGLVDIVITYVTLFAPILTVQTEMAVFRFLIEVRTDHAGISRVFSSALPIVISILGVLSVVATIVHLIVGIPNFWLLLPIIGATVFNGLFLQASRGLGMNGKFAVASILSGATTVISTIVLVILLDAGLAGIFYSMLFAQIVSAGFLLVSLKLFSFVNPKKYPWETAKKLLGYSLPLVPNSIAWWAINAADRTIIMFILGLSANGIYSIATKFPLIFASLFSVFAMSWTESASIHINDKNRDKFFSDTFDSAFRFFGATAAILLASIPIVFPFFVDNSYADAYLYVPIILLGTLFSSIVSLYSAIYVAKKKTIQVASTSIIATAVSVTINLSLIQVLGLYAAAIANVAAFLSMAVYRHFDSKKYVIISYDLKLVFMLILGLFAVTLSYYANVLVLNFATLILAIAYFLLLNRKVLKTISNRIKF